MNTEEDAGEMVPPRGSALMWHRNSKKKLKVGLNLWVIANLRSR